MPEDRFISEGESAFAWPGGLPFALFKGGLSSFSLVLGFPLLRVRADIPLIQSHFLNTLRHTGEVKHHAIKQGGFTP
jgi:hypothetical protein